MQALVNDTATQLDELCYVWNAVRKLAAHQAPGENTLRDKAAAAALLGSGGLVDLPLASILETVKGFLHERNLTEPFVERLHTWYTV